jgi:hypothetical protein
MFTLPQDIEFVNRFREKQSKYSVNRPHFRFLSVYKTTLVIMLAVTIAISRTSVDFNANIIPKNIVVHKFAIILCYTVNKNHSVRKDKYYEEETLALTLSCNAALRAGVMR